MFFDSYYLIFVVPALILSLWAQFKVKSAFSKYSKIGTKKALSGTEAAALIMKRNGISDVTIQPIAGNLTDNYNPGKKTLNLSQPVIYSRSISAVGVAAHETGHAIQDKVGYGPLVLRSTLVPAANIGSRFGPAMAIIGLVLGAQSGSSIWNWLVDLGLMLFAVAVLFYLITLPVEFNASHRALVNLKESGMLDEDELAGVREVLTAAAMTYVASALTAMGNFIRLLLISNNRRRHD